METTLGKMKLSFCQMHYDAYLPVHQKKYFLEFLWKTAIWDWKKIGYEIKVLKDETLFDNALVCGKLVMLYIHSNCLEYNPIFQGINRKYYIVLLGKETNSKLLISDSFIPTIPKQTYNGVVDSNKMLEEIRNSHAYGMLLEPTKKVFGIRNLCKNLILDYVVSSTGIKGGTVLHSLNCYAHNAIDKAALFFNKDSLRDLAYDLRYSGALARFDYMEELFRCYLNMDRDTQGSLNELKHEWELVVNKIMKYSMKLNESYYQKIFRERIPELMEKERSMYGGLLESLG
jgi:hypothetical protein